MVECYSTHCRLARAFSSVNKHTCPLAIISVPIDDSFNSQYLVVLSRYLISRCDTYRDTWVMMRYVSRYLFIALVNCNLSMMAVQYIGLGTLYPITTIVVYSVPTGQLVFTSRPVVRNVRYVLPLVNTSGQVGEYLVHLVRQFIWPSPSWRNKHTRTDFLNIITQGPFIFLHCYFVCRQRRWFSSRDVRVTMQITS